MYYILYNTYIISISIWHTYIYCIILGTKVLNPRRKKI